MAVTRDTATSYAITGDTATVNFIHVNSATNPTLAIVIVWRDHTGSTPTVSTVTYGGIAATFAARGQLNYTGDNYTTGECWYLNNPAANSNTVSVTLSEAIDSSGDGFGVTAVTYNNGNNGIGTNIGSGSGLSTTQTVSFVTETSTSIIVGGAASQVSDFYPATAITTTGNVFLNVATGSTSLWTAEQPASGGLDVFGVYGSASRRYGLAAMEILEGAAGSVTGITSFQLERKYTRGEYVGVMRGVI